MGQRSLSARRFVKKQITVPGNFAEGCAHFNAGRFFECHESFEEVWQEERGEVRDLYKGLIQIAAAFVHLSRGRFTGADRLLRTGVGYLAPFREAGAMGFDVERIAADAERMHARLLAAGEGGVASIDLEDRPVYAFEPRLLARESVKWRAWGFDGDGEALVMDVVVVE